jgi:hypothetical protein
MIVQSKPYLVPLIVAVTGHRDIHPSAEGEIRRLVAARFGHIQKSFPATPLRAMSGLAEGADMVFAEAALDLNIEVIAVLPVTPEVFIHDFESPAHEDRHPNELKLRFQSILERCADVVIVADHLPAGDPLRFAVVGSYLACHSHILFTLWDGIEIGNEGGTSHVVRFFTEGVPDRYRERPQRPLNVPESKSVHHLRVPRNSEQSSIPPEWSLLEDNPQISQQIERTMAALNRFNADSADFAISHPDAVTQSREDLGVDPAVLSKSERGILEVYATADALAIALQKRSNRSLKMIFSIGLLMVLAFEIYANLWASPIVLGAYIAGLLAAWWIYAQDKREETYIRFLDYRGLAEGLRVQLFWSLSGLTISVADHYLRKQSSELTWIRTALRALNVGPPRQQTLLESVKGNWIKAQAVYFNRSSQRDRHSLDSLERRARLFFIAGLTAAGIGLVIEVLAGSRLHNNVWMHGLVLLMGLLPATAAVLRGYADHRGLPQHSKQYDRMRDIFGRADDLLTSPEFARDPTALTRLVEDLGEEALSENADWILLHRERPIKPPDH